jgi:zinc/manganese transport system permease protein
MAQQIEVLFLPFLACLVLSSIHVYLGIHVISRKVIFVDIALAQIAAVGSIVAFLLGYDPKSDGAYFFSLGFAILAAVIFALTRTKHERVPQEAVIGLTYATASAAAILLADISPHGAEHLHDLLAGSIVWVTPAQIAKTTILYLAIGVFHVIYRRRFLMISLNPEEAYARGIRVRLWDFIFYLSFGVVITSAVQIAGVLLVFCYLVAPAVFAVMFFDDLKLRLITGWGLATIVSAVGLLFSYDRPSGPTIMVGFAVALAFGGALRAITHAPSRPRALAITAASLAIGAATAWLLYAYRPGVTAHHEDRKEDLAAREPGAAGAESASPEHTVGTDLEALRRSLSDTHENVRAAAVGQLAATADPRVVHDLVDALHDQSASVREAAASALGRLGSRAALPALQQGLRNKDEDEWVRLRLAQAVAALGDPGGVRVLLDLAKKGEARITRLEAIATLLRLARISTPPPEDPESEEGKALLRRLDVWWSTEGRRMR